MYRTGDTIAAVSSAAGVGHTGIVRISGPGAIALVEPLAAELGEDRSLGAARSWSRISGRFRLSGEVSCACQFYLFRAPHSYTTEDMVEIHLPGSPALLQLALGAVLRAGARMAGPGEFTSRAFLNNRIDLTEAQAVAAMINAGSDGQLQAAERLLEGQLRKHCDRIKSALRELLGLIEAGIDFSQEDIAFIEAAEVSQRLEAAASQLDYLLAHSLSWQQLDLLPRVVLAGPPNAGKSSLANRLTGLDRGIVSMTAGTTRDVLTAPLALAHGECLLVDTAGLGAVDDPLADASQQAGARAIRQASLVLWVADASDPGPLVPILEAHYRGGIPSIGVLNKSDLVGEGAADCFDWGGRKPARVILCSALRQEGIDSLREAIEQQLADRLVDSGRQEDIALTSGQQVALEAAAGSLANARALAGGDEPETELIALEIRDALDHLAVISGEVATEDVLDDIFSQFCIGK